MSVPRVWRLRAVLAMGVAAGGCAAPFPTPMTGQDLPVSVGGRRAASPAWPLRFGRPDSLILSSMSGVGPELNVAVDHANPARFAFVVRGNGAEYRAVVDAADLPSLRIVSRGAAGQAGSTGISGDDGMSGMDGSSASCPSFAGSDGERGRDGTDGGFGTDGQSGRDGGNIQVEFDCGASGCLTRDLELLRRIIVSEGGPGGPGGRGGSGGRGGRGGSGGSGTTCLDPSGGVDSSLFGGSAGMSGRDGMDGANGQDGRPGRPGRVRFSVAPRGLPFPDETPRPTD